MERWDDTCSPAAQARRGPSDAIFQAGGHMFLTLCKSKLHRATVTQAELHYEGSITIDAELLAAASILPLSGSRSWTLRTGRGSRRTRSRGARDRTRCA